MQFQFHKFSTQRMTSKSHMIVVSAGVWYDDPQSVELAKGIASKECVEFKGLYIHEGRTYYSDGEDSIKKTTSESWKRVIMFFNK